ncbi:2719_t:CDS:2 [Entrophospora sp. SA101]|nr:2719_t:CDS:2 [Entrophospora sp. SA101]
MEYPTVTSEGLNEFDGQVTIPTNCFDFGELSIISKDDYTNILRDWEELENINNELMNKFNEIVHELKIACNDLVNKHNDLANIYNELMSKNNVLENENNVKIIK